MYGVCEGLQAGAGSSGVTVALKEAQRASRSKDHSPPRAPPRPPQRVPSPAGRAQPCSPHASPSSPCAWTLFRPVRAVMSLKTLSSLSPTESLFL